MIDLAIKSDKVVTPGEIRPGIVLISDGRIVDIINITGAGIDCELIDIHDKALMPGVIDPHVHINEPGRTDWEGFDTATRSAIAGGVTTLIDMPLNSLPVTTTVRAYEEKLAAAKNQLHANCGFWGGIIPGNAEEIEGLIEKGVPGFKTFLAHSGIDEFPNCTEADLRIAMPVIAKNDLPLLVHAELTGSIGNPATTDARSYRQYLHSRPASWENDAISLMIRLGEEFNCRVHIVHLSSSGSIDQVKSARDRGVKITAETAQHYLFFNAGDIGDGQTQFKCAPPIRDKANNLLLWEALSEGIIDFVATDHSPAPPALKHMESGDFTKAWGGIASLQFALPALWTLAKRKGVSLIHMAKWLSEKPAVLAGIQNNKGKIAKGYDADLFVLDADRSFVVTGDLIRHKHKVTPYLQQELSGIIEQTFIGGIKVFDNGTCTKLNQGKLIIR